MTLREDRDDTEDLPLINYVKAANPSSSQETNSSDPFMAKAEEIKSYDGVSSTQKRRISNQLRKAYTGEGNTESKKIEIFAITGYNAFDVVAPPYNLDYLARLYDMSAPHHSAVDAKAANIVGLGYNLVETSKTKRLVEDQEGEPDKLKRTRRKLHRHKQDLLNLIDNFNSEDTFTEVMTKVWRDYETTGNGYIEVGRKKDGTIGYVGHIPSSSIRIRRVRDGYVQIIANRAVFFRNFGDSKTKNPIGSDSNPNELIHFKKYSPTNGFYGIPDIIAAKQAVAGNEFAQRFNLDYFENKAVPRHVIILKGAKFGVQAEAALMQFFETGLKGKNHRTLYIPLPGDTDNNKVDLTIKPVEAGIQDSSFNNYLKANRGDILMAHRVPISKIGLAEGVSLAVARDADKTFKEQVCGPEQRVAEKKVNKIIKEFTDAYELKFNELTLTDADTQSKIDDRYLKDQTILPNEVRARMGLPGIPGGDQPLQLTGQQKADVRAQGNRQRDAARSAAASDSAGNARNPKGDGRQAP